MGTRLFFVRLVGCWLLVVAIAACSDEASVAAPERAAEQSLRELARRQSPASLREVAEPPGLTLERLSVMRGEAEARHVRVVVELNRAAPLRRRSEAQRVIVDLEGVRRNPAVQPLTEVWSGGLERIWLREAEGGLRLELNLAKGAEFQMFVLPEPERLVFDVQAGEPAAPTRQPLVLIDPGHGGEDPGSPGLHGLWEGELTLDLARRLQRALAEQAPSIRTRLTRDSDVFLTLEERAGMANSLGADLFVSVHLNAANTVVERGGVATFVLDVNNDRNVLRLAARENGTRTWNVSPLQFLVGTLVRSEQRQRSERLARLVQGNVLAQGRRFLPDLADRGVKSAMFYVLVGAQMPAVLVEASFLTQPKEARALATPAYRNALAAGMAAGIARYLAEN